MIKYIKWMMVVVAIMYCGCSIGPFAEKDNKYQSAAIFTSNPSDLSVRTTDYFVEIEIDSLLDIQSPQSYTVYNSVVSPIPKDFSIILLKVHTIDDYYHVNNPFFWASFNEERLIEEYSGIHDYGINKCVERYDSIKSIGSIPSQCNILFLPINKDAMEIIRNLMKEKISIIVDKGKVSGDTIWSSCYYNKKDVDFSFLLSFNQRVHILDSIKEVVQNRLERNNSDIH